MDRRARLILTRAKELLVRDDPTAGWVEIPDGHDTARIPAKWNHFAEKDSRQINMLEQILVAKVFNFGGICSATIERQAACLSLAEHQLLAEQRIESVDQS